MARLVAASLARRPVGQPIPWAATQRNVGETGGRGRASRPAQGAERLVNKSPFGSGNVPRIWTPIIGARKLSQVKDNLARVGITLDPAHINRLDAVSRIEMGFPHGFFATEMVRALSSGGMRDQIDA